MPQIYLGQYMNSFIFFYCDFNNLHHNCDLNKSDRYTLKCFHTPALTISGHHTTWWIKATHLASASEEKCLFPRLSAVLPWRCPNPTLPSAGSIQVNKNSYRQMTQSTWCYEDKMPDIPISQQLFARVSLSLGKKYTYIQSSDSF